VTFYKEEAEVLKEKEETNYLVLRKKEKVKEGKNKDNKN
jgi:hypothetical protein